MQQVILEFKCYVIKGWMTAQEYMIIVSSFTGMNRVQEIHRSQAWSGGGGREDKLVLSTKRTTVQTKIYNIKDS